MTPAELQYILNADKSGIYNLEESRVSDWDNSLKA